MTPELEARWRAGEAPFDDRALVTVDDLDLTELLEILRVAVETLQPGYPGLFTYRDWHEHDGYITIPERCQWSTLSSSLESAEALYAGRDQDEFVRIAFYPPTFEWLLRFNIDDADSAIPADAWCSFDFSCTRKSTSDALLASVHSQWHARTKLVSAREHFDKSYGG